MSVFACQCIDEGVCNVGAPCPAGSPSCDPGTYSTCETTLWHVMNDNTCIPSQSSGLNAYTDGFLDPGHYRPSGPVTFKLLSRGDSLFRSSFCWYNVTGQAPAPLELHTVLDCTANEGRTVVFDIFSEPAYYGGEIGFAVVSPESHTLSGTCASGNCCAAVSPA